MIQKNILLEIQTHIEIAQSKIAVDAANEFISKNKSILENETSIESGFSATSFKTSAYWFWENKRQIISDTGIPYHYGYLTQKSTWKWDDMKFKGKLIKIKSSSSADSCYTGGTLTFLDVDKKVLSQVSFPCRTVAITDTTVPDKTFYLQLDSGDWGVSILITE